MTKTTANTPFFSKSLKVGSTRWACDSSPQLPKAYVLDMAFQPSLPHRWYLLALVLADGAYEFRAHGAGTGPECSLEAADLQAVLATSPVICCKLDTTEPAVAAERMERVVSNVMHNLLVPIPEVAFIWQRFATTDGVGAYAPPA